MTTDYCDDDDDVMRRDAIEKHNNCLLMQYPVPPRATILLIVMNFQRLTRVRNGPTPIII